MTNDTPNSPTAARGRRMRAAGWALVVVGVVVSWVWSVELTILGESVNASVAGASAMLLFCAGIVLIWRVSPHRGRRAALAFRVAAIATALGAVVAGVVPVAVIAASTGTVTAEVSSGTSGPGYRVAGVAVATSDKYHQTTLDLSVGADDRTAPHLVAILSFADEEEEVTCANSRQEWIHEISTVTLTCDSFIPIGTLESVVGIAVAAQ